MLLAAALVVIGSWASYHAHNRNDQYQLIQLGQCAYHGGKMYADCWENKPPGIAWLSALGLLATQGNSVGPWLIPAIFHAVALLIVWRVARRVFHERTARKTVLIAALAYALRIYDSPTIHPDFISSILELLAALALIRAIVPRLHPEIEFDGVARDEGRLPAYSLCAISGLLWAAAMSIKQVGCAGFLVVSFMLLLASVLSPELRIRTLRAVLAMWAGFALGVGTVAAVLWQQGTLTDAWQAIYTFNIGLADAGGLRELIARRAAVRSELAPLILPLWLGLTGVVMSFWYRRYGGFPLYLVIWLTLWWAAALILAGLGPSRSMRYWLATFPPMLVLATVGLHYIQVAQMRLGHPERLTLFVLAATVAIVLVRPALLELRSGVATSYAAARAEPTERERLVKIAGRVRELTATNDRIYVLDYASGIYVYSDRLPAVRFNYPRSEEQYEEILSRLESGAAKLLIVPKRPAGAFRQFCNDQCKERVEELLKPCRMRETVGGYSLYECDGSQ